MHSPWEFVLLGSALLDFQFVLFEFLTLNVRDSQGRLEESEGISCALLSFVGWRMCGADNHVAMVVGRIHKVLHFMHKLQFQFCLHCYDMPLDEEADILMDLTVPWTSCPCRVKPGGWSYSAMPPLPRFRIRVCYLCLLWPTTLDQHMQSGLWCQKI